MGSAFQIYAVKIVYNALALNIINANSVKKALFSTKMSV